MAFLRTSARPRTSRHWTTFPAVFLAVVLCFAAGVQFPARAAESPEYRLKAVFLFNFAQFVTWPRQAFPEAQAPLVIGVLGDDPFGAALDEAVQGEQVNGRPLVVRRYRKAEEIGICHILFFSRSVADRTEQIVAGLKGRPILTVGDIESPAMRSAMVRFAMEKNKIRLKINVEAARTAELTISSKLLRVADIVAP